MDENELMEYATQKMLKNNIGCLPVVNASGEVTGIVTQNDVFKCFLNVLGWDEVGSRITVSVKMRLVQLVSYRKSLLKTK